MNQPSHYMPAAAQPGFMRCLFSASYANSNTDSADTPSDRTLYLSIDRPLKAKRRKSTKTPSVDPVANTFHSAIALAEQDPLLQCVASWLDRDFEWRPMIEAESVAVDLTLCSTQKSEHRIGLSFQRPSTDLPMFPKELAELVQIQEHNKSVSLCVAQLHLSDEDQARLKPGSCIVLPETFEAPCSVSLFEAHSSVPIMRAHLDHNQNRLSFADNASTQSSTAKAQSAVELTSNLTRIVLKRSIMIDYAQWHANTDQPSGRAGTGAAKPASIVLEPLAGQAVEVQHHGADGVGVFEAHLIKVGSGLAAVLENSF